MRIAGRSIVLAGVLLLPTLLSAAPPWDADFAELQRQIEERSSSAADNQGRDAHMFDAQALLWPSDRDPLDVELRRAKALAAHLRTMGDSARLRELDESLDKITGEASRLDPAKDAATRREFFGRAREVRRQIALSNPLLDFDEILFTTGHVIGHAVQGHLKGFAQQWGNLFALSGYKSGEPKLRDVLAGARLTNGRSKGQPLIQGGFNTFDLSFDGRTVVFEWCAQKPPKELGEDSIYNPSHYTPDNTFNIYRVNLDGTELVQLTDTRFNDGFACWLPDGRIAFISERRLSHVRCHPYSNGRDKIYDKRSNFQPCDALYSMKADGSDVVQLSWHETSERFPRVTNDGRIVYTRWDYIDRDFNAGHSIWFCMPDGRDPRSPHGNYPQPWSTIEKVPPLFDAANQRFRDLRVRRPWTEYGIRPIPGSQRFLAVASIHHSGPKGELVLLDTSVPDDGGMAQVKCITSPTLPHESPQFPCDRRRDREQFRYAWPYPLSEDYYLVTHVPTGALVLLDRFGNREVLFHDPGRPVLFAVPSKPRPKPPVLPVQTWQGDRAGAPDHRPATIAVMNVYESDLPWPEGTKITALRVVQIFARPWSSPFGKVADNFSGGAIHRMALGTVPVEADGSAYFEAPVECEIYFQALDENGLAIQSMRSGTYVHPGEQMTCVGCHENKWKAVSPRSTPLALRRGPSKIMPEVSGLEPISFYRLAKPVLESRCIPCHQENKGRLNHTEYKRLHSYAFYFHASGGDASLVPLHGGHRTIPGQFGARASRMGQVLFDEKHRQYLKEGKFTDKDVRRLTLWLDCNSMELGSSSIKPEDLARQRAGQIVWPELDFDPSNPQRIDRKAVIGSAAINRKDGT